MSSCRPAHAHCPVSERTRGERCSVQISRLLPDPVEVVIRATCAISHRSCVNSPITFTTRALTTRATESTCVFDLRVVSRDRKSNGACLIGRYSFFVRSFVPTVNQSSSTSLLYFSGPRGPHPGIAFRPSARARQREPPPARGAAPNGGRPQGEGEDLQGEDPRPRGAGRSPQGSACQRDAQEKSVHSRLGSSLHRALATDWKFSRSTQISD